MDATGYPVCAANHKRYQEEQRALSALCPFLSLSLRTPLLATHSSVYFQEMYCMYCNFVSFSVPIKKVTAGNQENHPVK